MKETTTDIKKLKRNSNPEYAPFTWGQIIKIQEIGEYSIVEFYPWVTDGCTVKTGVPNFKKVCFHGWVNEHDCSQSWESLDAAIAGVIAYKYEGCNHWADRYFMKMITSDGYVKEE